jgi:hypothetical protein
LDPDDVTYRRSVRNMSIVLAVIVITIFAAIFIPPYINPASSVFPKSVSYASGFGFTMQMSLNSTSVAPDGQVLLTAWLNSSSDSVENLTAADSWPFSQGLLWFRPCTPGWPMGMGVMSGQYTMDNYTLGSLLPLKPEAFGCPESGAPQYFLFYPHSSEALASVNGSPYRWTILMSFAFGRSALGPNAIPGASSGLPPGVYTAVLADEWGDVLTANFRVS